MSIAQSALVALHSQLCAGVAELLDLSERARGVAFALVPAPVPGEGVEDLMDPHVGDGYRYKEIYSRLP